MPIPPRKAISMAIKSSVMVSMGEDTKGVYMVMFLVNLVVKVTSFRGKSIKPGSKIRSSYVRPRPLKIKNWNYTCFIQRVLRYLSHRLNPF